MNGVRTTLPSANVMALQSGCPMVGVNLPPLVTVPEERAALTLILVHPTVSSFQASRVYILFSYLIHQAWC